ncbi:hypothetical protein BC830DRAFT_163439 [Chytriomyces sp. MP71]|nr:hypothetical protein BC830DRAFT_163439 [Chytriomyces sp. MP71]
MASDLFFIPLWWPDFCRFHQSDHKKKKATTVERQPSSATANGKMANGASTTEQSIWSGFHKKALRERQNQLRLVFPSLFPSAQRPSPSPGTPDSADADLLRPASTASLVGLGADAAEWADGFPVSGLDEAVADNMIENCIGTMGLPVGLALNFVINGVPTVIPMVVEEPSVVAAVSGAAKSISTFGGGFTATTSERNIIFAQVVLMDVANVDASVATLRKRIPEIIDIANSFVPSMLARGGGVVNVTVRTPSRKPASARPRREREVSLVDDAGMDRWIVVHLHLDVCDAMGANAASTVSEGVAPFLAEWVRGRVGLRIVSNLCVERLAKATFKVPLAKMAYKSFTGRHVAMRMIEAVEWARDDPFRAATHNKGIMNGVDAVAVATGQDWRAIEAAAHAWAAGCGQSGEESYRPLTHYWVEAADGVDMTEGRDEGLYFCGEMEMPISVGTKGGVLKTNPVYAYTLGMMGNPDSKGLARAMISVGLAQNFAALRALTTEGIQKGHMSLHARNIAIAAGAPAHAINECVAYMVESGRVNQTIAKEYLIAHEIHTTFVTQETLADSTRSTPQAPSTFYIEATLPDAPESLTLNVAFETLGPRPVHLLLNGSTPPSDLCKALFNVRFDHSWIMSTLSILDRIELSTIRPERSNRLLVKKLKLLSVLINMLARSMVSQWPEETRRLVDRIVRLAVNSGRVEASALASKGRTLGVSGANARGRTGSVRESALQAGRPLLLALWQVFELRVLQWVGHAPLASTLLETQLDILRALTEDVTLLEGSSPLRRSVTAADGDDSGSDDSEAGLVLVADGKKPAQDQVVQRLFVLIEKHSKRFQTSQFLLCDASSLDPNLLTVPRLQLLKSIGDLMAWEQMCAHDVSTSRLSRDIASLLWYGAAGKVDGDVVGELDFISKDGNGFVFWLRNTLGDAGIRDAILEPLVAQKGPAAIVAFLRDANADVEVPDKREMETALLAMDLKTLFRPQILEYVRLVSKEHEIVKMIQEESGMEIFHKDTLLLITHLYRQYYDVTDFFMNSTTQ